MAQPRVFTIGETPDQPPDPQGPRIVPLDIPQDSGLRVIHDPTELLEGINAGNREAIRLAFSNEEVAKSRVASYLAYTNNAGISAEFIRDNYNLMASRFGLSGNNATAHLSQLLQRSARQWQNIKAAERRAGEEGIPWNGTILQRSIPLVRKQVEILSGQGKVKEHLKSVLMGAEQAYYSTAKGFTTLLDDLSELAEVAKGPRGGYFGDAADFWDEWATQRVKDWDIPMEIRQSVSGRIAEGIGGLPVYATFASTGGAGAVAMTSAMYDEASSRYDELVPPDQQSAVGKLGFSMTYALIAARLEKLGFDAMLGRVFKGVSGPLSLRQIVSRAGLITAGTATETGTEILQQMLLNAESLAIDPDKASFTDGLGLKDLLVISAVSAFGSVAGQTPGVVEDVVKTFRKSPLTADGSVPPAMIIRALADRIGTETVVELHEPGDPRREIVRDMLSENKQLAQQAEELYVEESVPTLDPRLPIVREAQVIQKDNPLTQPLFTAEEQAQIEELFREPIQTSQEEQALFEAELQRELDAMPDVEIIGTDEIIQLGGAVEDVALSKAETRLFEEDLRRSLGMGQMSAKEYNNLKRIVGLEQKTRRAKAKGEADVRREQERSYKIEQARDRTIAKLQDKIESLKLKSKEDIAALRLQAAERLTAQRVKARDQLQAQREAFGKKMVKWTKDRLALIQKNFQERKNLEEAIESLTEIVRQLPKPLQGNVLGYFNRIKGKVSVGAQDVVLRAAQERVWRLLDVVRLREAKAAFFKEVKKLQKQIAAATEGNRHAGKDLTQAKRLLDIMGFGDDNARTSLQDELELLRDRQDDPNYQETEDDLRILQESAFFNVQDEGLTASEYDEYLNVLKQVAEEGKSAWELRKRLERTKFKAISAIVTKEVQDRNLEKEKAGKKLNDPDVVSEKETPLMDALKKLQFDLVDYRSIGAKLSGLKRGRFTKFFDKLGQRFSEATVMQHSFRKMVDDMAKRMNINLETIGNTVLLRVQGRDMSIHQAMFVYSHSQNPMSRKHLANTEFVSGRKLRKEIDTIVEALPQKYKDFVNEVLDYHDEIMQPRMSELFQRRFGVPMQREDRYMPLIGLREGDAFTAALEDYGKRAQLRMNNMKLRKGSKVGFGEMDFIGTILHNNFISEHAISMYDVMREAQELLGNKDFRREVGKVSPEILKWMRTYLTRVARGKFEPATSRVSQIASVLRQNVSAYFISINAGSYAKVLAPMIAVKKDVGTAAWLSVMSSPEGIGGFIRTAQSKSAMMAARPHTNRIEIAELAQRSLVQKTLSRSDKLKEKAYTIYTALDMATTSMAWNMKYKEAINQRLSEKDAVGEADHLVNTYFPSGRVDQLPLLFSSGGLEKQMTTFTADMNKMFNLGLQTLQLKDNRVQEAVLFATFPVFLSALFLGLTDIPNDMLKEVLGTKKPTKDRFDQWIKDSARYMTSQTVGGIPMLGQGIEALTAKVVGDDQMSRMLSQQNMVFFAPVSMVGRDDYLSAWAAAMGIPGGNYVAPMIDDYLKEQFKDN